METLNNTLGTDQEIKDLFNLYETHKSSGIRYDLLKKAAKLVLVEGRQITCKHLYDLQQLMLQNMKANILTTQIKTLFYLGHVSTVTK